ncbi:glycosyltransferase family 4 protein [Candidatus Entotheonella palauensis]|uniref:glycosyltransferase family 4 protein n=1 Tax=Candidatus Entotheonella palauensis TaxID=93172 RepID=UPI0015C4BBC1|nr:glycosyltransferase family 4 protein [Candidatus Entotheonella palauensis]
MNDRICVAMLIQRYYPHIGGAERQLAALAPPLDKLNVELHIITRRDPGLARFEYIGHVPVHRLPIPGPKPFASLMYTLTALRLLRQLRPHVIHAHELLSPATTAVAAKRRWGTPIVAKVLRGGDLGDLAKLRNKPLGAKRITSLRQHIDAFITISHEIDAELETFGIDISRRIYIPNGVDTDRFAPVNPTEKQVLRQSLRLPPDAPLTLFMGRLAAEKRVDHLLAIWPAIRHVHPHAELCIIGTGEEESVLRAAAGSGVTFTGAIDDVAPYLQTADVFVLPSATEGLSNAMLEALATGLPVVATQVGGAIDIIEDGINGRLIPPDDRGHLQEALSMLLGDASLCATFGSRGRAFMQQHYALPVTAQRLRTLYDRVRYVQS